MNAAVLFEPIKSRFVGNPDNESPAAAYDRLNFLFARQPEAVAKVFRGTF